MSLIDGRHSTVPQAPEMRAIDRRLLLRKLRRDAARIAPMQAVTAAGGLVARVNPALR